MAMTEAEFSAVIRDTKEVVLSAIRKNLAPHYAHAVDDVAQEAYLRAFNALSAGKFRQDSKISTWLYAIARNEALRMNDKLRREERKNDASWLFGFNQISERNEPVTVPALDLEEIRNRINALPAGYRSIMSLYCDGLSDREISHRLAIPVGTVKSRKFRATVQLQQLMLKRG